MKLNEPRRKELDGKISCQKALPGRIISDYETKQSVTLHEDGGA